MCNQTCFSVDTFTFPYDDEDEDEDDNDDDDGSDYDDNDDNDVDDAGTVSCPAGREDGQWVDRGLEDGREDCKYQLIVKSLLSERCLDPSPLCL